MGQQGETGPSGDVTRYGFGPVVSRRPGWSLGFDPEGAWLGRVALPMGLDVYEIGSDYILGRSMDKVEVERILVYELVKGSGTGPSGEVR